MDVANNFLSRITVENEAESQLIAEKGGPGVRAWASEKYEVVVVLQVRKLNISGSPHVDLPCAALSQRRNLCRNRWIDRRGRFVPLQEVVRKLLCFGTQLDVLGNVVVIRIIGGRNLSAGESLDLKDIWIACNQMQRVRGTEKYCPRQHRNGFTFGVRRPAPEDAP